MFISRNVTMVCIALLLLPMASSALYAGSKNVKDVPVVTTKSDANTSIPSSFELNPAWQKLDERLRAAWKDAMANDDRERRFDVFVRCREAVDEGDQSFLFNHGFVVRAASGSIASGHLKAIDLQSVAELPFVASVRLSTKE